MKTATSKLGTGTSVRHSGHAADASSGTPQGQAMKTLSTVYMVTR